MRAEDLRGGLTEEGILEKEVSRRDFCQLARGDLESYWRKNTGIISASYGFSYVQGTL